MMTLEAIRLQQWYNSPQGETVAQVVGSIMSQWLCADHGVTRTLGLGFTQPYLDQIIRLSHDPSTPCKEPLGQPLGASPAEMGVIPWPPGGKNRIAQMRPDALPFAGEQFEQAIMAHFLEGSESPQAALRETWRILTPGGRLLIMVPNRGGLWARRDSTPFGWGRPFSPRQLTELLTASLFLPRQSRFVLFMPPVTGKYFLRAASTWEKAGSRWFAPLGGAILCEAEKVVYATTPISKQKNSLNPHRLPLPEGLASGFRDNNINRTKAASPKK